MQFEAELLEVKCRKTADLENEFTIKFRTTDGRIMALSGLPADSTVDVEVKQHGQ